MHVVLKYFNSSNYTNNFLIHFLNSLTFLLIHCPAKSGKIQDSPKNDAPFYHLMEINDVMLFPSRGASSIDSASSIGNAQCT